MGNGLLPGPMNGPDSPAIDDGTLARTDSPPPGPVGLDAKSGTKSGAKSGAKGSSTQTLNERVLSFAQQRRGRVQGNGQCFALADGALRNSGGKSAADYDTVTPDADYVWGSIIGRTDLQPGDIIQLRGYEVEIKSRTEHADGSVETDEREEERPHHTAIVESIGEHGTVTVLEQNFPEGRAVSRNVLHLIDVRYTIGETTTRVKVKGTLWFYRPQAR